MAENQNDWIESIDGDDEAYDASDIETDIDGSGDTEDGEYSDDDSSFDFSDWNVDQADLVPLTLDLFIGQVEFDENGRLILLSTPSQEDSPPDSSEDMNSSSQHSDHEHETAATSHKADFDFT